MKHFRKVCSVLLAVVMLAAAVPVCLAPAVSAADVGTITNGGFETGDFTGWTYYSYSTSIVSSTVQAGSYAANIGKHSTLAGHVALEQIVPVNTNATYQLSFYNRRTSWGLSGNCSFSVSVELGTSSTSFTGTGLSASTPSNSNSYTKRTYSFSTSTYKYARIRFNALGSGVDTRLDTIALTATNEGDTGTHAKPALTSFGSRLNRPNSDSNNVIVQPGFESTTSAQWNTSAFLTNGVSHVTGDAAGAHSGSGYLKYYRGTTDVTTWSQFPVTLPSAGTYVFSAWVRTPGLSSTNTGKASIGIMDTDTGKFLTYGTSGGSYDGHYSNPTTQLRSTATDDDWHLRSVTFYVGGASTIYIGMYGLKSTMYVDDISIHLETNGVEYTGDQHGVLSVSSTSVTNKYCESANSLIPDCNMNGSMSKEFWSQSSGWNNGFLEFNSDAQDTSHGTALHYKGTNPGSSKLHSYVKWVYVEPNTSYTVSFDYRVVSAGNQLMFIDNNIRLPQTFHTPSLGSASNTWKTYAFTFSTGNYNRIGVVFKDHASAESYFDDFRFFKTSDGISEEPAEEIIATLKPSHPEEYISRTEENSMDLDTGNGLAFMFTLESSDLSIDTQTPSFKKGRYTIDYTNGKVDALRTGEKFKLIQAGAVMTNQENVGRSAEDFTLENLNSNVVIDIPAEKAWEEPTDVLTYVVRIIKIPDTHKGTVIYARPYYVFEYTNGEQYTVYGDIVYDSYEKIPDINDGWLEWD